MMLFLHVREWAKKRIKENINKSNGKVYIGIAGALDFYSGFTKRAPYLVRKAGLEWFWRLLSQPWRWKRQLNLLKFVYLVLKTKLES